MEWAPMKKTMIEQAEEELQILETHHPNCFNYLKIELKSFIQLIHSQNLPFYNMMMIVSSSSSSSPVSVSAPPSSSATTQASSSCKKRKKEGIRGMRTKPSKQKLQRSGGVGFGDDLAPCRKVDRVEFVIERARTCLRKIQQFKTSL